MGKYMRKAKITADVTVVMDVSQQSSLGVRTRAKTLALRRLQATTTTTNPPTSAGGDQNPELSYLQLRSRRLEKPNLQLPTSCCKPKIGSCLNPSPRTTTSVGSLSIPSFANKKEDVLGEIPSQEGEQTEGNCEFAAEVSLGENNLEFEGKESRSTRESTPCSLIRDSSTLSTPGSSTRPTNLSANRRILNSAQRIMPTAHELEEFFAHAEQQQQRLFADRYNFDVVHEIPLPGRYEWVRVQP